MTHLFGEMAALIILYVATSMIVIGKLPPRATGLLGLLLVAPTALFVAQSKPGFIAGFLYLMLFVVATCLCMRLVLGKKLFSLVIAMPFRNMAHAWFIKSEGKRMRDIWPGTGRK